MAGAHQILGPASETYAGYAWEFLRRNKDYCLEYELSNLHVSARQTLKSGGEFKYVVASDRQAHKWGLECYASPKKDGLTGFVIWRQSLFPGGLDIEYLDTDVCDMSQHYRFTSLECTRHHFSTTDGDRITVLKSSEFWLQLKGKPYKNLIETQPFSIRFDGGFGARRRIDALRQLTSLTRNGVADFKLLGRKKAHLKLRNSLLAFDIRAAGGSYKDVAIALFGHQRVKAEWDGTGCFLKSRVIRSCKFAERMIAQDYQGLLPKKAI